MATATSELIFRFEGDPANLKSVLSQVRSDLKTTGEAAKRESREQEREQARLNRAVESLQKQRSAALIAEWRRQTREHERQVRAQERAVRQAVDSMRRSFASLGTSIQSLGRTLSVGLTVPLAALGFAAIKSAKDIDAQANTLRAFTGSTEKAEQRLRQLIATAQKTPGLTTSLGLLLDAQLRTASVTVETIDKVLPAIGRLNAVSRLQDPQRFAQNLAQLVSQNFERTDLKELVGQSPIAGQIIKELFNVDSPINSEAIRESAQKLGLTTTEAFFTAFAEAAAKNRALANVTESIGTRLDKLADRVAIALRPLGLAILDSVTPALNALIPLIERVSIAFANLPQSMQLAIVVLGTAAAALGPILVVLGSVVSALITFGGAISTAVTALGGFIPLAAAVGVALLAIVSALVQLAPAITIAALGIEALRRAWEENAGGIRETVLSAFNEVKSFLSRIVSEILVVYQRVGPEIEATVRVFLNNVRRFWAAHGEDILRVIRATWEAIKPVIINAIRIIGDVIILFLRVLRGDWAKAWQSVEDITLRAAATLITVGVKLQIAFLKALFAIIVGLITWQFRLVAIFRETAGRMFDAFVGYVQKEGIPRAMAAVLSVALALSSPAILAAYAASGAAQARARQQGYDAIVASEQVGKPTPSEVGADMAVGAGILRKKTPGAPAPTGGKGGGGTKDDKFLADLEASRVVAEKELEQQRHLGELLQLTFDENRASLEEFYRGRQTLIDEHFNTLVDQINREQQALDEARARGRIKSGEAQKKDAELVQRTTEAQNKLDEETRRNKLERQRSLDQQQLDVEKQLARIRDAQRELELRQIEEDLARFEITETESIKRRQAVEKAAHEDRLLLLNIESQQLTISAARKIELDNEKIESELRYTDAVKRLTRERLAASVDEQRRAATLTDTTQRPDTFGVDFERQFGPPPEVPLSQIAEVATRTQGVFQGLGAVISDSLGLGIEHAQTFGDILTSTFGQVASAVGDAVKAFVLFGSAQGSFKKFAAEVIASVAQMAVVQAVFEFAQGLAMLALNFFFPNPKWLKSAALHFQAAAVFGVVAGATVGLGRAVAGNSFSQGEGGGATGVPQQEPGRERDRRIIERRSGGAADPNAPPEVIGRVAVDLKYPDGYVETKMVQIYDRNGRFRGRLRSDLLGEANG